MNNNPIGLFDSGMGGLSVWRVLQKSLANESLIFYGDGARCPYGSRSAEEIRRFTVEAVEQLLGRGCKLIVIACNTATAAAVDLLRQRVKVRMEDSETIGTYSNQDIAILRNGKAKKTSPITEKRLEIQAKNAEARLMKAQAEQMKVFFEFSKLIKMLFNNIIQW